MTNETRTTLSPAQVLQQAKRFFTAEDALSPATLLEESESHVTMGMFRSRLAISATVDPSGKGTRVRISTLRHHDAVGKFLAWIASATPEEAENGQ